MSDLIATAVQEALRATLNTWAVSEVRGNQARVLPAPDFDALASHLNSVHPTWSLTWACDSVSPPIVRARLSFDGAVREGLSSGHTLEDAKKLALADAFRFFGVSSSLEAPWVEYDLEDGANTSELSTLITQSLPAQSATPLPDLPKDPQMELARAHIDTLMEQLREQGKGGEALKLLMRGYGETLAESRAIYKELQALQRRSGN